VPARHRLSQALQAGNDRPVRRTRLSRQAGAIWSSIKRKIATSSRPRGRGGGTPRTDKCENLHCAEKKGTIQGSFNKKPSQGSSNIKLGLCES